MKKINTLIDLKDRTALITGATGKIGLAICETLAELGSNLIMLDNNDCNFKSISNHLKKKWKVKIETYKCDFEKSDQFDKTLEIIIKKHKKINVLVNNAAFVGTSNLKGWNTVFEKQNLESWRRAFEVNLTAVFSLTQKIVPLMKNAKGASIINIGSIYGNLGPDWTLYKNTNMGNPAAYASSKGGLIQLTKWLSTTLAPNIRANSISPGGIKRNQKLSFIKKYEKKVPLGRMGFEEDLKGIIAYFASDLSSYTTGQNINIDGGFSAW